MRARSNHGGRNDAGFTLLEVLIVVGLLGTLVAMAIMVSPSFLRLARADSGVAQVVDVLRLARETAVSQRRNIVVTPIGLNALETRRQDIGANGAVTGTTVLRTVEFENGVQFRLEPSVTSAPPDWTNGAIDQAVEFPSATLIFTSEGTFVNQQGDPINGGFFLARPSDSLSPRAITIFGATALIRVFQWNGREWVE
jgi:prepilin-type N-terminal cleavage/methylation domain-containing protein